MQSLLLYLLLAAFLPLASAIKVKIVSERNQTGSGVGGPAESVTVKPYNQTGTRQHYIYSKTAFGGAWTLLPKYLHNSQFFSLPQGLKKGEKLTMKCTGTCTCTFYVVMYHCAHCEDRTGGLYDANVELGWGRRPCGPRIVTGSSRQPTVVFKMEAEPGEHVSTAAANDQTTTLAGVFVALCTTVREWCLEGTTSDARCASECQTAKNYEF